MEYYAHTDNQDLMSDIATTTLTFETYIYYLHGYTKHFSLNNKCWHIIIMTYISLIH